MSYEQKALEILRVMAQTASDGDSLTIASDSGFGSATLINSDGAHTHVGGDWLDDDQKNFDLFIDSLHSLLVGKRGLSWVNTSVETIKGDLT